MMYHKASLNGKLSMDTGKGQFLQIDPGIGKLLSILSLQALPKRISLDSKTCSARVSSSIKSQVRQT